MEFSPIGQIRSPYMEKFGIPRQANLAGTVHCTLELDDSIPAESLRGIELSSHLWITFVFHKVGNRSRSGKMTVRPPRLGGNQRIGVFASRSPFRPNTLGLSAVRLLRVEGRTLQLKGGDFLDKTPVLDIKPYVPYADCIPEAQCAWAPTPPRPLDVRFVASAQHFLDARADGDRLQSLLTDALRWDPRPAYIDETRTYGVSMADMNIRFTVAQGSLTIEHLENLDSGPHIRGA